jgi:hypothetical protein
MMKTKTLWRIYAYSRFGEENPVGYIYAGENVPLECINSNRFKLEINEQPCALSFDKVNREGVNTTWNQ